MITGRFKNNDGIGRRLSDTNDRGDVLYAIVVHLVAIYCHYLGYHILYQSIYLILINEQFLCTSII